MNSLQFAYKFTSIQYQSHVTNFRLSPHGIVESSSSSSPRWFYLFTLLTQTRAHTHMHEFSSHDNNENSLRLCTSPICKFLGHLPNSTHFFRRSCTTTNTTKTVRGTREKKTWPGLAGMVINVASRASRGIKKDSNWCVVNRNIYTLTYTKCWFKTSEGGKVKKGEMMIVARALSEKSQNEHAVCLHAQKW